MHNQGWTETLSDFTNLSLVYSQKNLFLIKSGWKQYFLVNRVECCAIDYFFCSINHLSDVYTLDFHYLFWFIYDFVNIIGSRKQAGLHSKCTDYKPTMNDKVVRFIVTSPVKSTAVGELRTSVLPCNFCRLIIGTFWAQSGLFSPSIYIQEIIDKSSQIIKFLSV